MLLTVRPMLPPVLPGSGHRSADCPAIILVEQGHPSGLAGAFLDLVGSSDAPIATMVALSSPGHLGRVGKAAFTGDILKAIGRTQGAYGRGVHVIHGFPLAASGFADEFSVRGLREIEIWLSELDLESFHTYLKSCSNSSTTGSARHSFKLPISRHSRDSCVVISSGWEDLPRSLPPSWGRRTRSLS